LDLYSDFSLSAHCEAAAEFAIDAQARGKTADPGINDGGSEEQEVIGEGQPRQPWPAPRQCERNERQRQQEVEEFGENEAQRVGF
jgi:hypothetical protein